MKYGIFNEAGQCLYVVDCEDAPVNGVAMPDAQQDVPSARLWLLDGKVIDTERPSEAHVWRDGGWVLDSTLAQQQLADAKTRLFERIDSHAANIYSRWTRFEAEYRAREATAQAFKDAGYQSEPGLYVTSFAEPAGLTAQAAADAILAQAAALRAAQDALAVLRMRKYEVARAANAETAQTVADEIVAAMDEIMRRIG